MRRLDLSEPSPADVYDEDSQINGIVVCNTFVSAHGLQIGMPVEPLMLKGEANTIDWYNAENGKEDTVESGMQARKRELGA